MQNGIIHIQSNGGFRGGGGVSRKAMVSGPALIVDRKSLDLKKIVKKKALHMLQPLVLWSLKLPLIHWLNVAY